MKKASSSSAIQDVLDALNETHDDYKLLSSEEEKEVMTWLKTSFPIAFWGRISWPNVDGSTCANWSDKSTDLVEVFEVLCERQRLSNCPVELVWGNASTPVLRLHLKAVREHAATIFTADFDTWIIDRTEGWCVEVYHEGEICFGRVGAK